MSMQAVWYEQRGAANQVLQFGKREMPIVEDGDVLVRLHASAVNPSDIKKRSGGQDVVFSAGFIIPHSDGEGVIEAVGNAVSANSIGEGVWIYQAQFERHLGTAAQYVAVPSMTALTLPDNVGFDVGACLGIPFYALMFKNISINLILVYNLPGSAKQQAILDINRALANNLWTER